MEGMLILNAPVVSWQIARAQVPMVFGLPASAVPSSVAKVMASGLVSGAEFIAIARHKTVFRGKVAGAPFIDETPVWPDAIYAIRLPFTVERELGQRWFHGRDTRTVLTYLYAGTVYRMPAATTTMPNVNMRAFDGEPPNANQRTLF